MSIQMENFLVLRNRIIKTAHNIWTFGCFLYTREYTFGRYIRTRDRLINGISRDGKAILIYVTDRRFVPRNVANLLHKCDTMGGIAGVALSLDDAWEILYNGEEPRKRKARTYEFRKFINDKEEE